MPSSTSAAATRESAKEDDEDRQAVDPTCTCIQVEMFKQVPGLFFSSRRPAATSTYSSSMLNFRSILFSSGHSTALSPNYPATEFMNFDVVSGWKPSHAYPVIGLPPICGSSSLVTTRLPRSVPPASIAPGRGARSRRDGKLKHGNSWVLRGARTGIPRARFPRTPEQGGRQVRTDVNR